MVDDNPSMLKSIKRLLREHGLACEIFERGAALLRHGDFDSAGCLIIDINLSDGSGIELHHRLADIGVDLPVIYITGNDNHATRMAAIASGCAAYLTKPFTARSLIEPIKRAMAMAS
ncbi:response regulator transcription factor [Bradyrhizobium tropiciagri]|uniref:response regulator transcription factor n=1 Tax=Bradyrhizobium tropiciagri TaxID=312253 RepID=UPI0032E0456B